MTITSDLRGFALACDKQTKKTLLLAANRIDAELAERYVALPVDADDVPIRVGDVVVAQLLFGGESKPLVVDRMELSRGRDGYLWCVALDTDKSCWNQPSLMRHYTPPTVEDVLDEFANAVLGCGVTEDEIQRVIAEYAKRLRLAGEDE